VTLVRRSFAKHFCPACHARLYRVRPPIAEAFVRQLALLMPYLLIWSVVAFVVEQLGGAPLLAMLFTGIVAAVSFNPLLFSMSTFHCNGCGRTSPPSEVISRGWSLRL
jgi:hypothetical protein